MEFIRLFFTVWRGVSFDFLWFYWRLFYHGCGTDRSRYVYFLLTENQGFAAGIAIPVILLNYYSVSLAEYVSATALGSAVALCVCCLLLGVVIRVLTKNENLAYAVALVLMMAVGITYLTDRTVFEGLLSKIMTELSLFERFYRFVNGVFDLTAIVYYLTVIVFFLFLSVQSLEKRRYN